MFVSSVFRLFVGLWGDLFDEIDADGDCFGWGCFAVPGDTDIMVEELSGLEVNWVNAAVGLTVADSADVKREIVLLGTLGGASACDRFCF